MVTLSRVGIKVWYFINFTNTVLGQLNVRKKNPTLSSFAAMGGKWHFRKVFLKCKFFEFDCCFRYHALLFEKKKLDFLAPEYNVNRFQFKMPKFKNKNAHMVLLYRWVYWNFDPYSSVTSFKLGVDLSQQRKMILQLVYFVCHYFWAYLFFIFGASLSLNNILETINFL